MLAIKLQLLLTDPNQDLINNTSLLGSPDQTTVINCAKQSLAS